MEKIEKLELLNQEDSRTCQIGKSKVFQFTHELTLLGQVIYFTLATYLGVVISLLSALSFSFVDILIYDIGQRMHPAKALLLNFTVMLMLNTVVLIAARPKISRDLRPILYLILSGFFCGSGSICLLFSVMIINPGNAVSLYFTMPLYILVLKLILKREKPKVLMVVFAFISIAGVLLIVKPSFLFGENLADETMKILGGFLALMSALCHGSHVLIVERLGQWNIHILYIMLTTSGQIVLECFLLCIYFDVLTSTRFSEEIITILSCGVANFAGLSFLAFAVTIEKPFIVTSVMTSEVVFTFAAQHVTLNLPITWHSIVGGLLIGLSCISIKILQRKQEETDVLQEPLLRE